MKEKNFKMEIEGKELSITTGKLAEQTNGSALVRYGQTEVLATAVMSKEPVERNYFPLMVDYEEKFYAAGKIKGSRWVKREGRPTDEAILSGRLVDRAIRPLFNSKMRNEVQIVLTVLSFDGENDPVFPALIGASIALSVSDIPWNGPVGGISIGKNEKNEWTISPTISEKIETKSEIFVSGIEQDNEVLINMIEGHTPETKEEEALKAIERTKKTIKEIIEFQNKIVKEIGLKKATIEIPELNKDLKQEVEKIIDKGLENAVYEPDKQKRLNNLKELKDSIEKLIKEKAETEEADKQLGLSFDLLDEKTDEIVHKNVLENEKRPDNRKTDEVRKINCQVKLFPRVHGSGLFQRGETQVLSMITLAPPGAEQLLDQMELEGAKRFMHDYNFPSFSVGEVGPMRGPGRREIGHGTLAEKALKPIIPDKESFPYTIRIVSEVLSSNGSSSMASVCGSVLALLDSGVPVKTNIAGIAMGLMTELTEKPTKTKFKVLTDIQGPEDHHGDMDLKIAGSREGITAMQMDVKLNGVTMEMLKEAFPRAKKARIEILEEMEKAIKTPRPELSQFAPRVYSLTVNPNRIRDIIGPGGKTINELTEETGATIDIEDDGTVFVSCEDAEMAKKAISRIKSLTRELKKGETFEGKVVKIADFGAFVELSPGQEGLLHISELAPGRVEKVEDYLHQGDTVGVKIKNIDPQGKISLELTKPIKK
ncbi:MAG: polyribonucleotide nucleotidyltransferase [Candidatus Portnoybacteria bacterium]|nr:polyribonucleotide nucleotidyltransferase [Candidatus Portnoybacteria bacterium]